MEIQEDRLDIAIASVLEGVRDPVTTMSTISCMVFHHYAHVDWAGFYRNKQNTMLEIGPYQGTLGCLFIPFNKGVCGHVATTREPIIVPDVNQFDGHIVCAVTTKSELVLPVMNARGDLIGVFDLDSNQPDAFSQEELDLLQAILTVQFAEVALEEV